MTYVCSCDGLCDDEICSAGSCNEKEGRETIRRLEVRSRAWAYWPKGLRYIAFRLDSELASAFTNQYVNRLEANIRHRERRDTIMWFITRD